MGPVELRTASVLLYGHWYRRHADQERSSPPATKAADSDDAARGRSNPIGIWELYDTLVNAPGPALQARVEGELRRLRAFVDSHGGEITLAELAVLPPSLARSVAAHALRHEAWIDAVDRVGLADCDGDSLGLLLHNSKRLAKAVDIERQVISSAEITPAWFCAQVADWVRTKVWALHNDTMKAWRLGAHSETRRLRELQRDVYESGAPESSSRASLDRIKRIKRDAFFAGFAAHCRAEDVAAVEDRLPSVIQLLLHEASEARASSNRDASGGTAEENHALLQTAKKGDLIELEIAGAVHAKNDFGPMPTTKAVVDWLQQEGYLRRDTFSGLVFANYIHATPAGSRLTAWMRHFGLQHFELAHGKGYSSNPLVARALAREAACSAEQATQAHTHGWERRQVLVQRFEAVLQDAAKRDLPWLFLNDGSEGLEALIEVCNRYSDEHGALPAGFVAENTQSGTNAARHWQARWQLPFAFSSHAEHALKKKLDRLTIGPWAVRNILVDEKRDFEALKVVLVGGGAINQGVAGELWRWGVRDLTIIDPKPMSDLTPGLVEANPLLDVERLRFLAPSPEHHLPQADYVFVATGEKDVFDRNSWWSPAADPNVPRVVVNMGSPTDFDHQFIHVMLDGFIPNLDTDLEGPWDMPERQTMKVRHWTSNGMEYTKLLQCGMPLFGGGRDRTPMYADVITAVRLAHLCVAAGLLKGTLALPEKTRRDPQTVVARVLEHVAELAREHYPELSPEVGRQPEPAQPNTHGRPKATMPVGSVLRRSREGLRRPRGAHGRRR